MQYITAEQMARIDERAVKHYDLSILQMMENAGRNLARFTSKLNPRKIIVMCGGGNNGGGGLVSARHLNIYGFNVEAVLASTNVNSNVKNQLHIIKKIRIPFVNEVNAEVGDVIIDALIGYGIKGNPQDRFASLIRQANKTKQKGAKIVSLDIPSGIDPNTGEIYDPAIDADYTVTLALPKTGLRKLKTVYLANIGIPNEVYRDFNINIEDYFKKEDIILI
ncbi:NAD(P)H-hydrate epimerase [Thermoproteota archaeon]